jgi:Leucine-rich repeat (LRR) protein
LGPALKELTIHKYPTFRDVSDDVKSFYKSISKCTNLRGLDLESIMQSSHITKLPNTITKFSVSPCHYFGGSALDAIGLLNALPTGQITELSVPCNFFWNSALKISFSNLTSLEIVDDGKYELMDYTALAMPDLPKLERLSLSFNYSGILHHIAHKPLIACPRIKRLTLEAVSYEQLLEMLYVTPHLKDVVLSLGFCYSSVREDELVKLLTDFQKLRLNMTKLTSSVLKYFSRVKTLHLYECVLMGTSCLSLLVGHGHKINCLSFSDIGMWDIRAIKEQLRQGYYSSLSKLFLV